MPPPIHALVQILLFSAAPRAFGFNHAEAIRAFTEAARLHPNCAICYWGTAYARFSKAWSGADVTLAASRF